MDEDNYVVEIGHSQDDDWYGWHSENYNSELVTYKEALLILGNAIHNNILREGISFRIRQL